MQYFQAVYDGTKTFEVRKNDRSYAVGDVLVLKEWDVEYTGSGIVKTVTYMLDNPIYVKDGYVIMGLGEVVE
ncbi:DUF3850 domain-containing protein [Paenibacillus shirakamiensis]|uniref:DUF3850 domain-containing protein n=1 Tax=Paenibacillus shirakamiensis TaxID=1265935 RepID=UPI001AE51682